MVGGGGSRIREEFRCVGNYLIRSGWEQWSWVWHSAVCAPGPPPSKENKKKSVPAQQEPVKVKIVPVGPSQTDVDRASQTVEQMPQVQQYLRGARFRLLSFEVYNPDQIAGRAAQPRTYQATYYDYTHERSIIARGEFDRLDLNSVAESNFQPLPNDEEFDEAVRILSQDEHFATLLKDRLLVPFRPMPPVAQPPDTATRIERTVNVGLSRRSSLTDVPNEIVGVHLTKQIVERYTGGAPATAQASPDACGVPNAGQATTPRNTAGQYQMTVTQGPTTLWEMLIIRPAVSSGTRASGIEVQNVKYKGKLVLKRGHAPVLNVKYGADECGPYRDWQYQEGQFFTPAGSTDPAPGVRVCPTPAATELENGTDMGDFRGVAIYNNDNGTAANTSDDETVLLTELEAGWYRYIMEWRFGVNGVIKPRFGFGATDNTCVCSTHTHHVYWRFDFDISSTANRVFLMEKGKKFSNPILTETKVTRNYGTTRSILVQNAAGDEGYLVVPNASDGLPQTTDPFGKGDLWILAYKNVVGGTAAQNELDDGFNSTTSQNAFIQIDSFVNGESVNNTDVVVWYGSSFIHSDGSGIISPDRSGANLLTGPHVVGPDLRPRGW
jgi:hypothetical protein